jgi:hypothetical protein
MSGRVTARHGGRVTSSTIKAFDADHDDRRLRADRLGEQADVDEAK